MKKNEKDFMKKDKNLEKVAGGKIPDGGIQADVKTGDISLVNVTKTTDSHNTNKKNNFEINASNSTQYVTYSGN